MKLSYFCYGCIGDLEVDYQLYIIGLRFDCPSFIARNRIVAQNEPYTVLFIIDIKFQGD